MNQNSCSGCHDNCQECQEFGCPVCGKNGIEVDFETVKSLSKPIIKNQLDNYKKQQFYLCISRNCKNGYYTVEGAKIPLNQMTVPVWFKHDKDEYIVCYCRRITLQDVVEVVQKENITNRQEIISYLNKQDVITDCLHNNPTGKCCTPLFDNAIKYALKQKNS